MHDEGRLLDLRGANVDASHFASLPDEELQAIETVLLARAEFEPDLLHHLRRLPIRRLDLALTPVTDEDLQPLRGLELVDLDLTGTRITGASASLLASFPLETLRLASTGVDDAAVEEIRDLSLKRLDLSATRITDAAASAIGSMRSLEFLDLSRTSIGDETLEQIARLPDLEWVGLSETRSSREAIARLQARRPNLRISTDKPFR